jgi:hypothetical protein
VSASGRRRGGGGEHVHDIYVEYENISPVLVCAEQQQQQQQQQISQ